MTIPGEVCKMGTIHPPGLDALASVRAMRSDRACHRSRCGHERRSQGMRQASQNRWREETTWVIPVPSKLGCPDDDRTGCHRWRGPCGLSGRDLAAPARLFRTHRAVNDEGHLPYQRPPLSKAYLKGTGGPDSLMFRPEKFYHDQKIDLIADRARVDRPRRAQSGARLRRLARLRPPGAGDRRAQSPARHSQRQSRQRALFADARRKRGACGTRSRRVNASS